MDDQWVTNIAESEVVTGAAYLLIYRRVHPSIIPINQHGQIERQPRLLSPPLSPSPSPTRFSDDEYGNMPELENVRNEYREMPFGEEKDRLYRPRGVYLRNLSSDDEENELNETYDQHSEANSEPYWRN